jgi:Flp pilus assembly pilin Flp
LSAIMPATKIKIHNQKTGVSMAEYGLIGASVLVVAVSALILLGKTLTASLGTFGNSLSRPTASPPTLSSAPVKPSVPPQAPIASQSNFPGKQLQISLNSGQNLNISGYPDNLEKSVRLAQTARPTNWRIPSRSLRTPCSHQTKLQKPNTTSSSSLPIRDMSWANWSL